MRPRRWTRSGAAPISVDALYFFRKLGIDIAEAGACPSAVAVDPETSRDFDEAAVEAEIAKAVKRANAKLSRVEQLKKYKNIRDPWLPGGDELTPAMKLRRKPIGEKYAAAIEALYES